MKTEIVLTSILRDKDLFLVVKRNENDEMYPGAWEFPGGHLEDGELLKDGLHRELLEEIGYDEEFSPIIINYTDDIILNNNEKILNIEIDFLVNVDRNSMIIKLSDEHSNYEWVTRDSELLDEYIKAKLKNIK